MARLIERTGGRRAHPDADRRTDEGADFVLGSSVIELKILEDEGLDKPERQRKLAELFQARFPRRPTIVLDRGLLDQVGQRTYDNIVESRLKKLVGKARGQLAQSRVELGVKSTVLWVINNGLSSLSHEALLALLAKRARNDTSEIDAVVVSGAYFFSDSFDSCFLWPMECTLIHLDKPFQEFEALHKAWDSFTMTRMTALMQETTFFEEGRGPVVDLSFVHEGVTYVLPTPPMGKPSDFFVHGRPRANSTRIEVCPKVATVFPGLSRSDWAKCKRRAPKLLSTASYDEWVTREASARSQSSLKPFILVPVSYDGWRSWASKQPEGTHVSIYEYANAVFQSRIVDVMKRARRWTEESVVPRRYMLVITEEIGQDMAFDVSHLAEVFVQPSGGEHFEEVWEDRSIFFEHALAIAAAEAIARGLDHVYWQKDRRYAWH